MPTRFHLRDDCLTGNTSPVVDNIEAKYPGQIFVLDNEGSFGYFAANTTTAGDWTDLRSLPATAIQYDGGDLGTFLDSLGSISASDTFVLIVSTEGNNTGADGSPGAPFLTIQAALDHLTNLPDPTDICRAVILVEPGFYNEDVDWTPPTSYSAGSAKGLSITLLGRGSATVKSFKVEHH